MSSVVNASQTVRMPGSKALSPVELERENVLEVVGAGRDLVRAARTDLSTVRILHFPSSLSRLLKKASVVVETVLGCLYPVLVGNIRATSRVQESAEQLD